MADNDLIQDIADVAAEPLIYEAEGVKTQNRSLDELIRADTHIKASAAAADPLACIRKFKVNPPGAV